MIDVSELASARAGPAQKLRWLAHRRRSALIRCSAACAIVAVAFCLRLALLPLDAGLPFLTFYPAMTLTFLLCGQGAGALAAVLSALIGYYVFFPPYWTLSASPAGQLATGFFLAASVLVGLVVARSNRYKRTLEASTAALQRSEQRYLQFLEDQTDAICRFAADGTVLYVNQGFCRMVDRPREQILDGRWQPVAHSADVAMVQHQLALLSPDNPHVTIENRFLTGDGSLRWGQFVNSAVFDARGRLAEVQSVGRDITERKRMEEQLQDSQSRLADSILNSPLPIMMHAEDGEVLMISTSFTEITGYTPADIPTIDAWLHKAYGQQAAAIGSYVRQLHDRQGAHEVREHTVTTRTGTLRLWEFRSQALRPLPDGRRVVLSFATDITERRDAERALKEKSAKILAYLKNASDGVCILDGSGMTVEVSDSFCTMLGYPREQLLGQGPALWDAQHGPEALAALVSRVREGTMPSFETVHRRRDGSLYDAEVHVACFAVDSDTFLFCATRDITLRRRNEAALSASEERFRGLIDQNHAIILQIDPDSGQILAANQAAAEFYGWSRDELCTKHIQDIRTSDPAEVARERAAAARSERRYFVFEHRLADGTRRIVEVHSTPIVLAGGVVLVSIIHDVTQREQQMTQLATLLAEQKAILDSKIVGILKLTDRKCVWANQAVAGMFGYALEEFVGQSARLIHPDDRHYREFGQLAYPLIQSGAVYRHEAQLRRKDGSLGWYEVSGSQVASGTDQSIWSFVDISKRKAAEDTLEAALGAAEDLYNQAPAGYHSVGPDGTLLKINDTELAWLGYPRHEVLGIMKITDLLSPRSARESPRIMQTLFATGRLDNLELEMRRKDGSTFPILVNATAIIDDQGCFLMSRSSVTDLSDRVCAEQALQRESAKNLALLRNASDGIHILDASGRIIDTSDSFCTMLGYSREELIGMCVTGWDAALDENQALALIRAHARLGARTQFETTHRRKDGSIFPVEVSGFALEINGGLAMYYSSRDISERKRLESAREEALLRLKKVGSRVPGVIYQYRLRADGTSCFPYASEGIRHIYGVDPDAVREDAGAVFDVVHPDDRARVIASIQDSAHQLKEWRCQYRVVLDEGPLRWVEGNAVPERESDGAVLWHGYISDITERKLLEDTISDMAFHDALTRLPNRRLMVDRLTQNMAAGRRSGAYAALLVLDLDNFKPLNDRAGHAAGDALLIEVASRLTRCLRENDTVARFGGDEFAVILADLGDDAENALVEARALAERMRSTISRPYCVQTTRDGGGDALVEHRCTASIGGTTFRGQEASADELLARADDAMYRAKQEGRDTIWLAAPGK